MTAAPDPVPLAEQIDVMRDLVAYGESNFHIRVTDLTLKRMRAVLATLRAVGEGEK